MGLGAIFGLLGRVPLLVWPLLAALVWGGAGHWRANGLAAEWAQAKAAAAIATQRDEALARGEERRRVIEQEGIRDGLAKQIEAARARAAADGAVLGQLRHRIAALGRAVPGGTGAGPADAPAARLGAVAGECVQRLAEVVDAARRSHAAGSACERAYDALSSKPK